MRERGVNEAEWGRLMLEFVYSWGNNPKRKLLKGKTCKVIARGKMNSALVEFNNKQREIISRNAVRRKG